MTGNARRTSCGSPCSGGCATRAAAATSLRCCSNGAAPSPPRTIRAWACRVAPRVTARRRAKRRGRAGRAWSLDETDVQVAGRWCSRDRALDREGALPDARRSAHRGPGRRAALPAAPGGRGRAHAAAHHDGPASARPPSDPLDPREEGPAPMSPGLEQSHRAKPPGGAAALRPHAGLRQFRVRRALLLGVR